ncbi:unnamed protein product [Strongylus vulgaris]|uniref:Uncharacterized protein n=1 Tax=Strongylus vulgaris TaxID=40348 RepID=A0A3P7K0F1_STRVU|nr:unnamed protein product [Strongylus vulgaris]
MQIAALSVPQQSAVQNSMVGHYPKPVDIAQPSVTDDDLAQVDDPNLSVSLDRLHGDTAQQPPSPHPLPSVDSVSAITGALISVASR